MGMRKSRGIKVHIALADLRGFCKEGIIRALTGVGKVLKRFF